MGRQWWASFNYRPAGGQDCVNLGVTPGDPSTAAYSSSRAGVGLAVNGALNENHYPVAQPPKLKSPWGLPFGAGRVSVMGLQPGVCGGGGHPLRLWGM